jgi:alpha-galactosidase
MSFAVVAEVDASDDTLVYAEGWQSWSPSGVYRVDDRQPRPANRREWTMGFRPGRELPRRALQAEGILVVAQPSSSRAWFPRDVDAGVPSLRVERRDGARLVVSADAPVRELAVADGLDDALATVGDRLSPGACRSVPPGWCSWSAHFQDVTEAAVREALAAASRLELPFGVVQIDDGYEACVGDWLEPSPAFGSLRETVRAISGAGLLPGLWSAPFLVGARSRVARAHPEWLVGGVEAGWNWAQRLLALDVTHPGAAAHLEEVYGTFRKWGVRFHKLDFMYAGALEGTRWADCSGVDAYREGLRLIRRASGGDAVLVVCGAPLVPSIGLVDVMRIGPDVLPEPPGTPDLRRVIRATCSRAWTHARLWAADPDSLVVGPDVPERDAWAAHVRRFGGVVFSGDRLDTLDAHGVELTRRTLRASSREPSTLSALAPEPPAPV